MLTTSSLSQYSMTSPPTKMLNRTPEVQSNYDSFMRTRQNSVSFIDTVKTTLQYKPFHFIPNDFPYHTSPGIEHKVCWYGTDTSVREILEELKKTNTIITCWKNYSYNRSIKEVNHIHVFIMK
jgi:hypothetical protein